MVQKKVQKWPKRLVAESNKRFPMPKKLKWNQPGENGMTADGGIRCCRTGRMIWR
jgi:hypothetical protein